MAKKPALRAVRSADVKKSSLRKAKAVDIIVPIKVKLTKTALFDHIVEVVGDENIQRKHVAKIYKALEITMLGALGPKGIGEFSLPGLVQFKLRKTKGTPAQKAGLTKINPFTKEEYITVAKPAKPPQWRGKAFVRATLKRRIDERNAK